MDADRLARAVAAALSAASALDLEATSATIVHNSNKLALRIAPCDVFARVAVAGHEVAELEVRIAQALAAVDAPVAVLEPRLEPVVSHQQGFAVTWWTFYDTDAANELTAIDFADALTRLHAAMRGVDVTTPHVLDRVAEAERVLVDPALSPALDGAGRRLLLGTLTDARAAISRAGMPEQLLHGEPHPGNVLNTAVGPRFIDLETCCRGPVEFDVAHAPIDVAEQYRGLDADLLRECQRLILAMVGTWRWEIGDEFPDGLRHGRNILELIGAGPPWPTISDL